MWINSLTLLWSSRRCGQLYNGGAWPVIQWWGAVRLLVLDHIFYFAWFEQKGNYSTTTRFDSQKG